MNWEVLEADCVEQMRQMDEASVDAIVTDPPYGLGFMGKEWDSPGSKPTMFERKPERANTFDHVGGNHNPVNAADAARTRGSENVKAQQWHEAWATEALRVLKPGGHLLAFGGTRTYHRLACAVEDAGFEIRDSIAWQHMEGVFCACDDPMRRVREGLPDVSAPASAGEGTDVQPSMQRQASGPGVGEAWLEGAEGEGNGTARDEGSAESGMEGRGDVLAEGGELPGDQVRPSASVGATDGAEGWLHHGASATDGAAGGASPSEDGSGASHRPRSTEQQPDESGAMAVEWISQGGGAWPGCPRCGKPLAPPFFGGPLTWEYGSGFPKSLDVSKAIDKRDAAQARLDRAFTFQRWLGQHLTPQQVNEATGTEMGHHLTKHPTQPAVATAPLFDLLRPLLPEVPDEIEKLVAERTVESENFKRREKIDQREMVDTQLVRLGFAGDRYNDETGAKRVVDITTAHTPEAAQWEGWGTALKPAHEPIVVARKPLAGTVAENVLEHGTGALNIDGTRIGSGGHLKWAEPRDMGYHGGTDNGSVEAQENPSGRWPANVVLSHLPECERVGTRRVRPGNGSGRASEKSGGQMLPLREGSGDDGGGYVDADGTEQVAAYSCAPGCPVAALDEQSGELHSQDPASRFGSPADGLFGHRIPSANYGDCGGASRFFLTAQKHRMEECAGVNTAAPSSDETRFRYCAKASRGERNAGLDGFEEGPPPESGRTRTNPAPGRQSTVGAPRANHHPTVKPIALMRWLVRLVCPVGGTVLDPFAGSGTTGIAAVLEGFDFIGIEREAEYVEIARARIAWWEQHQGREAEEVLAESRRSENLREEYESAGQMGLEL